MMIVTFTRLLAIRMVASVRSDSARNCMILASAFDFSSSSSLKSLGVSEKKAISDPEAKPDTNNRRHAITPATIAPTEGVNNVISLNNCKKSSMVYSGAASVFGVSISILSAHISVTYRR